MNNGLGAINSQGVNELAVNAPSLHSGGEVSFQCEATFNASCSVIKTNDIFFFCESTFNASCSIIKAPVPGGGGGFHITVPPLQLHRVWELRASFKTDSKFVARATVHTPRLHSAQAIFHVSGRLSGVPSLLRTLDISFETESEFEGRPDESEDEELLLLGFLVHSGLA